MYLVTSVRTKSVIHRFIPVPTHSAQVGQQSVVSQSTRIYADPGTSVQLGMSALSANNSECRGSISGYTITP